MTTTKINLANLSENILVELAFFARKHRLVNPNGTFDKAGRWYPDECAEGGTPVVRTPSRAYPYSYMTACRTRRWCAQLPDDTRDSDAAVAVQAIAEGRIEPDARLAKLLA